MSSDCTTNHKSSTTTIPNNMRLQYKVSAEDIQQTHNTTMLSLKIRKEFHNIPIMKIPDTSAAHHLKTCGFDQMATTLKGKMGDHPI